MHGLLFLVLTAMPTQCDGNVCTPVRVRTVKIERTVKVERTRPVLVKRIRRWKLWN